VDDNDNDRSNNNDDDVIAFWKPAFHSVGWAPWQDNPCGIYLGRVIGATSIFLFLGGRGGRRGFTPRLCIIYV
jgi:hypothetical protein